MQKIERYGVIALLFLVVTFVAVYLWEPAQTPPEAAGREPGGEDVQVASGAAAAEAGARKQPAAQPRKAPAARRSPSREELIARARAQARTEQQQQRGDAAAARPPLSQPAAGVTPRAEAQPERAEVIRNRPRPTQPAHQPRLEPQPAVAAGNAPQGGGAAGPESVRKAAYEVLRESAPESRPAAPVNTRPAVTGQGAAPATYQVQPGDTLSVISSKTLGTSKRWKEIADLNGVDPKRLSVGQVLKLPTGAASVAAAAPVRTQAPAPAKPKVNGGAPTPGRSSYVVQSGDVLSRIAARQLGSAGRWKEIVALNPGIDPDRLLVGTRLKLPAGAATASPAVASNTPSRATRRSDSSKPRVR